MPETTPATGDVENPANKAFAAQRNQIRDLERQNEDLQSKLDDSVDSGDPNTSALRKQMRVLEGRIDEMSLTGISEEQIEIAMVESPWIRQLPTKSGRIQAVKDLIARDQRAETNAGDPSDSGRSRSETATQAHLTGGGPSAGGRPTRSDYDRDLAKYNKDMGDAKTQPERDALVNSWSEAHPDEGSQV